VDSETQTADPWAIEQALVREARGIRALVIVHLYGQPADMRAITGLARSHNVLLIEDCAQAHGATFEGRRVGSWGHAAAFSFYPTKNLGALGDGGAIATDNEHVAAGAKLLRQYGWRRRYVSDVAGTNSRLDELQAAILRVKLRHLDADNDRRRAIAARYDPAVAAAGAVPPPRFAHVQPVFHQYVLRTSRREELREWMAQHGITTAVLYPVPVHRQPAYAQCSVAGTGGLPVTDRLAEQILCLPVHPELTDIQVDRVVDALAAWGEVSHAV
jgi:dTDP-4-amino-4,6-dideoxygalactose transaminase